MEVVEFLLRHHNWDSPSSAACDRLLRSAIEEIAPEWWDEDTHVAVARDVQYMRHMDADYCHSWLLLLGDFTGGALVFDSGERFSQRRIWHNIYGRIPHWNEPHRGTKYSIIVCRGAVRPSSIVVTANEARKGVGCCGSSVGLAPFPDYEFVLVRD